jgi:transcriptional regulator with XRE-family HTH domain
MKMKSGSMGVRVRSELRKLKKKLRRGDGHVSLASLSKISPTVLSRILSGKARLSAKALQRLAGALDIEDAKRLVAAYQTDLIPKRLQDQICVCVRKPEKEKDADCCWQYWEPFIQKIHALPPESRAALEHIVESMRSPPESLSDKQDVIWLVRPIKKAS